MSYLLVLIPSLLSFGDNYWNNTIFVKWYFLCSLLILMFGWHQARKIHWSVLPAYLSTALASIWYLGWRDHQYANFIPSDVFALNKQAAYVLVVITLGVSYFASVTPRALAQMSRAFALFCLVDSLWMFWEVRFGAVGFEAGGLLGNASMNGCMIAATFPLLLHQLVRAKFKPMILLALVPCAAIALTGRTAPILAMCLATSAYAYRHLSRRTLGMGLVFGAILAAGYVGLTNKTHFLDGSGRLEVWYGLMKEFFTVAHTPGTGLNGRLWWFGIGPGISAALVPHLQQVLNIQTCCGWWPWLHNDWLQLFFEQGVVGVLCYLPLVYYVAKNAGKQPELFASVVTFSFVMLVNYPLRLASGALLAGFLVTYILKGARHASVHSANRRL